MRPFNCCCSPWRLDADDLREQRDEARKERDEARRLAEELLPWSSVVMTLPWRKE